MKTSAFTTPLGRTARHAATAGRLECCQRELIRRARETGLDTAFIREIARREAKGDR